MGGIGEWIANLPWWAIVLAVIALALCWLAIRKLKDDRKLVGFSVKSVRETLESLIIAIVLVFGLVRPFIAQTFYIPSESMVPTLHINDRLLVSKFTYRFHEPRRHDIIVFRAPAYASPQDMKEHDLVKRVIGLPGDVIEFRDHHLYVNRKQEIDKFVNGMDSFNLTMEDKQYLDRGFQWQSDLKGLKQLSEEKAKVLPGYLLVMGDNRNNSNDGRFWGGVERKRVIGKAEFMFWPPSRIGLIR